VILSQHSAPIAVRRTFSLAFALITTAALADRWRGTNHLDNDPIRGIAGLELARLGWTYDCMECHRLLKARVLHGELNAKNLAALVADPDCLYGATLLGLSPDDYYLEICRLADRLALAPAHPDPESDTPCCPGPPSTPSAL